MIGRMIAKALPLRAIGAAGNAPRAGAMARDLGQRLRSVSTNRYSRRVARMKLALPAIGFFLLLLVTIYPRVAPLFDRLRFSAIDLKEARELRMINPRYAGTDRSGHPFVITAAVGRQVPARDDVMSMDNIKADLQSHSGATIVVTADNGVYQSQTQFLDAFGHVTMVHENGTTITTSSARLDVPNNAAEGHEAVEGHGPSGDIKAQGFQVIDKGAIVVFTGKTDLWLRGAKSGSAPPAQPTMPAPVTQAAAQIEAKVMPPAAHAAAHPAAAHSAAAHPATHAAAKAPAKPKPAPKKPG